MSPSPREERAGGGSGSTAIELSELLRTWSAEFIPLPAHLRVPWGSGLKSALLNSTAVGSGRGGVRASRGNAASSPRPSPPSGRRGRKEQSARLNTHHFLKGRRF